MQLTNKDGAPVCSCNAVIERSLLLPLSILLGNWPECAPVTSGPFGVFGPTGRPYSPTGPNTDGAEPELLLFIVALLWYVLPVLLAAFKWRRPSSLPHRPGSDAYSFPTKLQTSHRRCFSLLGLPVFFPFLEKEHKEVCGAGPPNRPVLKDGLLFCLISHNPGNPHHPRWL